MKNLSLKLKVAIIATVIILAVGIVLISVLGFNESASNKNGYELSVKAEANIGNASSAIKNTTDEYLKEKGVKVSSVVKYDDGGQYVFLLRKDYKDVIDVSELTTRIKTAFSAEEIMSGLDVTVKYNETVNDSYDQTALYLSLAIVLSAVVLFVYVLIAEKSLASAIGALCPSVIAALLSFALIGISRVPAKPFLGAGIALSAILSAAFSLVIVNRFAEEIRLADTNKPNYEAIAKNGEQKGFLRVLITASFAVVSGILLIGFGIVGEIKWAGIQVIIAALTAACSSLSFTGAIWKMLKKSGKANNDLPVKDTEQVN